MDDLVCSNFYKKESKRIVDTVEWELFNIDSYVKSLKYPDNDLIFLMGPSGEGKSVFATQFILKLLENNVKNNNKTNIWVLSETNDSVEMLIKSAVILQNLFPSLKKTWNDGLITIAHTKSFEDLDNDYKKLKLKKEEEIKNIQFIFFLDDIGDILSSKIKEKRSFFDSISSQGRHYNIITIINTQKVVGLSKVLLSQIGTCVIVGKINYNDWDFLIKNGNFHSFKKKTAQEFYDKYFSLIGLKRSRNILIFQKTEQNIVYLQKVSDNFVKLVKSIEFS